MVASLTATPRRSVLLVGEHGVGKTALAAGGARPARRPRLVFEATARQVHAGAVYVGELEERVKRLADSLRGRDASGSLPELQEALFAGQHSRSPQGLLDALLPHVESGATDDGGRDHAGGVRRSVASRPRACERVRRDPGAPARRAPTRSPWRGMRSTMAASASRPTTRPSRSRSSSPQQFLPGVASPGDLLRLVARHRRRGAPRTAADGFDDADVLATLAAASGLPLALLDPAAPRRSRTCARFFEQRVLGQPEAVDCLVERIAHGQGGPHRPDAPARRLPVRRPDRDGQDRDREDARRVPVRLGRPADPARHERVPDPRRRSSGCCPTRRTSAHGAALDRPPCARIRSRSSCSTSSRRPREPIWDLFLQVFDDGRLTDRARAASSTSGAA